MAGTRIAVEDIENKSEAISLAETALKILEENESVYAGELRDQIEGGGNAMNSGSFDANPRSQSVGAFCANRFNFDTSKGIRPSGGFDPINFWC